jgi:hypothetical protein
MSQLASVTAGIGPEAAGMAAPALSPPVAALSYGVRIRIAMESCMSQSVLTRPGPWVVAAMILVAGLSRLLPHAWNFTPVEAMALFGGAYFAQRWLAFALPLGAMLATDAVLGFHSTMPVVYACIAASVALGFVLRGRVGVLRVAACGLAGSLLFFVVTNWFVWLTAHGVPGYEACTIGLWSCYVAAVPFFKGWLLGTAVWSLVLFGGFELLRRRLPMLRLQTV